MHSSWNITVDGIHGYHCASKSYPSLQTTYADLLGAASKKTEEDGGMMQVFIHTTINSLTRSTSCSFTT
jgi:hypothetical protein